VRKVLSPPRGVSYFIIRSPTICLKLKLSLPSRSDPSLKNSLAVRIPNRDSLHGPIARCSNLLPEVACSLLLLHGYFSELPEPFLEVAWYTFSLPKHFWVARLLPKNLWAVYPLPGPLLSLPKAPWPCWATLFLSTTYFFCDC
jgi:hypothetical protein